jgi:hypothetical protein
MKKQGSPDIIVTFEKNEETSKWGFTALFGNCSVTYSGYDTKDQATMVFERLKGNLKF